MRRSRLGQVCQESRYHSEGIYPKLIGPPAIVHDTVGHRSTAEGMRRVAYDIC